MYQAFGLQISNFIRRDLPDLDYLAKAYVHKTYKHHCMFKFLVTVTPDGLVLRVPPCCDGSS